MKTLSDAFCAAFGEAVAALADGLAGVEPADRRPLAGRLVARLVFLKFAERLGWLDGDTDCLLRRLRADLPGETLFPTTAPPGGWETGEARIDRKALESVFDGLLNRFTFDAGGEARDAISPDWLASAYERLISGRHGKGAYYTDPADVNLMCRESLRLFLKLRCPEVAESAIHGLLSASKPGGQGPEVPHEQALALFRALFQVTVCDPAVGAGSFPVGMARQLFEALRALARGLQDESGFRGEVAAGRLPDPDDRFRLKAGIIGRSVYGCDIDAAAVEIARMRLWLEVMAESRSAVLPGLDCNLVVGDALVSGYGLDGQGRLLTLEEAAEPLTAGAAEPRAFAEVFLRADPGFDIVLANPPYVRKEEIEPLFRQIGIPLSKKRLQEVYRRLAGVAVSGHADLYLYFYFRGLSLLKRQGGVLCYLSSNAWLDVGYGQPLRQCLLERTRLAAVVENRSARSFPGADVNTVIMLCSTDSSASKADSLVRFVSVRGGMEEALPDGLPGEGLPGAGVLERANLRVISMRHKDLAAEMAPAAAAGTGGKWGGRYLRAPSVLHTLLNELEWRPLGQIADVVTYLNTGGCDDFFFVRMTARRKGEARIASQAFPEESFWVESRFVVPLVRSPLALARPLIRPEELRHYLLRIPEDADVGSLAVNDYLEWGEAKGFAERSGSRHRSPWWKLPVQAFSGHRILVSRHHHDRFNVFYNPEAVVANSFYGLVVRESGWSYEALMAGLSSTLSVLLAETYGRTNQGQGVLNTYGEDLRLLPVFCGLRSSRADWRAVLQPYLERPSESLSEECGCGVGHGGSQPPAPSAERSALDSAVFDCLGLDERRRAAILRAACQLVEERLSRVSGSR